MKKLTTSLMVVLLTISAYTTFSQNSSFNPPKNPVLKTADDYAGYEQDMINAAKWLEETDLDKEQTKRKDASRFVLAWISGSPSVTVSLYTVIIDLTKDNPDLLDLYFASYAAYALQHKDDKESLGANRAALQSMIKVYQKGLSIKKSKAMLKLIKMNNEGKIDEYIKKEFK